ncbi:MAG: TerB family tellurite resistance protein [Rhizobiaceae bacterium]|nr:TerB family tellurite resistance protein [Rhizobiaceae bacterium]
MSENPLAHSAVRFFAMLVKADEKILNIETNTVAKMLEEMDSSTSNMMLSVYNQLLVEKNSSEAKRCVLKKISEFGQDDKLYILRCLWRIAVSDKELHAEEEKLIYEYIDAVNIDRRTAIEVQASLDDKK